MFVEQVMLTPVVTVEPTTPLWQVWALMEEQQVSYLPVVEDGRLLGMVSEDDVDVALGRRRAAGDATVETIMRCGIPPVARSTPIPKASLTMLRREIGALPVVEQGRVVGLVTASDVFQTLERILVSGEYPGPGELMEMAVATSLLDHRWAGLSQPRRGVLVGGD
jgi:acetoin utilization protein AcuB